MQGGVADIIISDVVAQGIILALLQQQTTGFYSQPSAQTQAVAAELSATFLALAMAQAPCLGVQAAAGQGVASAVPNVLAAPSASSAPAPSTRLDDTEALRQAYQNKKKELGYLDSSDVFVQAIALLGQQTSRQNPLAQNTDQLIKTSQTASSQAASQQSKPSQAASTPQRKYIALTSMLVTPLEKAFLAALSGGRITPIAMPKADEKGALDALAGKECHFLACRGAETEVRAVFRDILANKCNLADCALVYLGAEYPQLVYKMAPRFALPVTLEGGIPLSESLLFATLQTLQNWVAEQYPIDLLYPLLINRDCAPKNASQLAKILVARPMSWGKVLYTLADGQRPSTLADATWADWQAFLACLLALDSPQTTLEAQQKNLQILLARYTPRHRMGEGTAYHATLALLESAAQTCVAGEALLARLLALMQGGSYQPSAVAEPSLLCMPVAKALLSGRKTLYVMGLTRYALEEGGAQSPILLDAEREALSPALDTVASRAARLAAQFYRLVATHQGKLVFSYPNFESVHMAPVQPAPFYTYALAQTPATEQQVSYLAQTPLTAADFAVASPQPLAQVAMQSTANTTAAQSGTAAPQAPEGSSAAQTQSEAQAPTQENASETEPETTPNQNLNPTDPLTACMQNFVFSASSLEAAFTCPLQFYLQRVLRLQDDAPTPQRIDRWLHPGARGIFIHLVLEQYYLAEIAHSANASNPAPNLDALYQSQLEQLEADNPCRHQAAEQAKAVELPQMRQMIDDAIAWTAQNGRIVQSAEQRVGPTGAPIPLKISEDKTIQFVGSIDRVDIDATGGTASTSNTTTPNTTASSTYILDYKSGDARTFQENMGVHLQHYLYTLAYEQTHEGETVAAAGYLLLNTEVAYREMVQTQAVRDEMQKKVLALLEILADEEKIQTPCPCYQLQGSALVLGDDETRKNAYESCKRYCPYSAVCAPYWEGDVS